MIQRPVFVFLKFWFSFFCEVFLRNRSSQKSHMKTSCHKLRKMRSTPLFCDIWPLFMCEKQNKNKPIHLLLLINMHNLSSIKISWYEKFNLIMGFHLWNHLPNMSENESPLDTILSWFKYEYAYIELLTMFMYINQLWLMIRLIFSRQN